MAQQKKLENDLAGIAAEKAKLEAQLVALAEREKATREAALDAGRGFLLAALERVKIPAMNRVEAKALAAAITRLGASEALRRLAREG
ncbi:hypothetical protein [Novosphingobium humi]|uniref:Relaxasome subunit MobC n=1 Tax=Novosphingobium humi TaxID=2282397 RepID=A0ABY7U378_9SPHN|nr:hypothetical protein [Novosphingobium humi]WCT79256.1 hypothetical protein PQ457_19845 [Novosphingobium humi]